MPIYRKGEGQWTPEKQAGLIARAEAEAESYSRRESLPPSSIPPAQLQRDNAHERGWAIGINPHIKVANTRGPVSGAGLAKGKASYKEMSPGLRAIQARNAAMDEASGREQII
jgi:hypothetical protein